MSAADTTTFEQALDDRGYSPEQADELIPLMDAEAVRRARIELCEFIARMLVRLDRNSAHGRAIAAACGFNNGLGLDMAASEFGVSKQYLSELQIEVNAKLADLMPRLKVAA